MPRLPVALTPLRYYNYRLLFGGLLVSILGSMMRNTVVLWHVTLLVPEDQRALALGAVGLVRVVPIVVFSMVAGVVADRYDRRRVLLLVNGLMGLLSITLAALTLSDSVHITSLYAITALMSGIGTFDNPARQSLFPALLPESELPRAISLNMILFQVAAVGGPALGGLLIARAGVGWAYLVDAASFLVLFLALVFMRNVPVRPAEQRAAFSLGAMRDGLRFVFGTPLIRSSMLLDFFATFFASAMALLPLYAQDILRVGAEGYGVLSAAPAVGALITSLAMVPLIERIEQRGRVLIGSVLVYGLATVVFGLSATFWLTYLCLAVIGASDTVSAVLRNVIRQLGTPNELRGRMTSVNMIFFLGGPQLGELEAGLVATWFGPVVSVLTGGLACIAVTLWIAAGTPELLNYRRSTAPVLAAGAIHG
jgi:MFS family permease